MTRTYYHCWFRLDDRDRLVIWYTNEKDGLLTSADGKITSYSSAEELIRDARSLGIVIEPDQPTLHDLDRLAGWLDRRGEEVPDCETLLNIWNLLQDVSTSVGGAFDSDQERTKTVYNKLFYGNNLSVMNRSGVLYEPSWTEGELLLIKETLGYGLTLFRRQLVAF